jgi:hypothetical protein
MSYTTLTTNIADWMHRADLAPAYSSFVANAEAEFNDKLRVRQMEVAFPETALVSGAVALPAGFESWKVLYETSKNTTLKPKTNEFVRAQEVLASVPVCYALEGVNTIFWPSAGSVKGTYYQAIPSLETNTTNWLETARPDVYLYTCLKHASIYIKNMQLVEIYGSISTKLINEINMSNRAESIGGGLLVSQAR